MENIDRNLPNEEISAYDTGDFILEDRYAGLPPN
jgi:hypothetical protein